MPYSFAYAVKDDPSYNDYAHQETGDDKGSVTGSYRVLLPGTVLWVPSTLSKK